MRTNDQRLLKAVMRVVAGTDPKLARRMRATEWDVLFIDNGNIEDALTPFYYHYGPMGAYQMVEEVNTAYGLTFPTYDHGQRADMPPEVMRDTWLNWPFIEYQARALGVPVAELAANILVHEFAHRELDTSDTEPEAYAASMRFAEELGRPALVAFERKASEQHAHRLAA